MVCASLFGWASAEAAEAYVGGGHREQRHGHGGGGEPPAGELECQVGVLDSLVRGYGEGVEGAEQHGAIETPQRRNASALQPEDNLTISLLAVNILFVVVYF